MNKYIRSALLFTLVVCGFFHLAAQELPSPTGFINDFAGVINREDFQKLTRLSEAIKEKTGAELAVVTVKSYEPYGTIAEYSLALVEKWGIGEKGKDTGVMLLFAASERRVRIEVGYGLEGAIPDGAAGRILDIAVIPPFREGNFSGGLVNGAEYIAAAIAKENGLDPAEFNIDVSRQNMRNTVNEEISPGALLIIIVILFIFRKPLLPLLLIMAEIGRAHV